MPEGIDRGEDSAFLIQIQKFYLLYRLISGMAFLIAGRRAGKEIHSISTPSQCR